MCSSSHYIDLFDWTQQVYNTRLYQDKNNIVSKPAFLHKVRLTVVNSVSWFQGELNIYAATYFEIKTTTFFLQRDSFPLRIPKYLNSKYVTPLVIVFSRNEIWICRLF